MNSFIKKCAVLTLAMSLTFTGISNATPIISAEEQPKVEEKVTGQNFLKQVKGEFQPLFDGGVYDAKYDHYWNDYAATVVGGSQAADVVTRIKASVNAPGYGETAVDGKFYCGFISNVATIEFGGEDGKDVTYTLNDGTKVNRSYEFVKEARAAGEYFGQAMGYDGYLYKCKEEANDEFTYLFMCPDTPASTYHLEFRYGSSEEDILKLTDGKYKNWLAAGFMTSAFKEADEDSIQKVVSLFVIENIKSSLTDEGKNQRAFLVGKWNCDVTDMRKVPGYEKAQMYVDYNADGIGKTYVDMNGTGNYVLVSEYNYFAYDNNPSDNKNAGVYIANSITEGTVTPGSYEIKDINGKKALCFKSTEGTVTYFADESAKPAASVKPAASAKPAQAATPKAAAVKVKKLDTVKISGNTYKVTKVAKKSAGKVAFTVAKNAKVVTVPKSVKLADGKNYKVTAINAKAFAKSKATKVIIKTAALKKASVKNCLKSSKVKKITIKVGSKKKNKATLKTYKSIFTKKNAGLSVKIK